jgi:hypothetical protein
MSRSIDNDRLLQAEDLLHSLNARGLDLATTGRALHMTPAAGITTGLVAAITGLQREMCAILKARNDAGRLLRRLSQSALPLADVRTAESRDIAASSRHAVTFPRGFHRRTPIEHTLTTPDGPVRSEPSLPGQK